MPHVIVKLYPGRTDDVKIQLAEKIAEDVAEIADCGRKAISVAIEEVDPNDWAEKVYRPNIIDKNDRIVIKPGYNPFE
jgi:4-oxalocrotonate tautomerase